MASMKLLTSPSSSESKIQPKYQKLLAEFPEILEPSFNELSTKHGVTHKIQVNPEMPPCRAKVRPLMPNSEKAVKGKEAWEVMEKLGVVEKIKPNAKTEFSSALHLVPKPDGSMRPCSDFRQLNAMTTPSSYPLPALKTFTHKLHGAKVFSKIDLQAAFHNVLIDKDSVDKTTTVTPWGVYV